MRQPQRDAAALEQWKPLVEKMAFKAAQRARKIGSALDQDDFRQELQMTVLRAMDAYNPDDESGAKFITFLYRAMYNEMNKLLRKDDQNVKVAFTCSGDNYTQSKDDGEDMSVWGLVEDDTERSPEDAAMDQELIGFVRDRVSPDARAVLDMLTSKNQFVAQQVAAYNHGVEQDAMLGGIRRFSLDLNFSAVCKLLGFASGKIKKLGDQVEQAIAQYGHV